MELLDIIVGWMRDEWSSDLTLKFVLAVFFMSAPFFKRMFKLLSYYPAMVIPSVLDKGKFKDYVSKRASERYDEEIAKINKEVIR